MENKVFKIDQLGKIFLGKGGPTARSWADKGFISLKKTGRNRKSHYLLGFDEVLQAAVFIKFYDMGYNSRFANRLAKKITAEDWHEIREEGKTFFVLENFEHAKACQVRCFDENEGPFIVDQNAEGVMILNGKRLLEEVTAKIERFF